MTEADADPAELLVEAARILAYHRITEAYGHVSVRVEGDHYLLTPRIGPGLSRPETLLRISIGTGQLAVGDGGAPIERSIHTAIYRNRPDVQAVARIHSFGASALSVTANELRPVRYLGAILGRTVLVHDVADLVLDEAAGTAVADALSTHAGLMLRGNGQVVVGRTLEEAVARALYLDESARLLIAAQGVGTVKLMTDDEVRRSAAVWADPVNVRRTWDYHRWLAMESRLANGAWPQNPPSP